MKKIIFLAGLFFGAFIFNQADAQTIGKRIKQTAKQTADQKAEQKTSEEVSSGIDKGFEGVKSIFKKKNKKKKNEDNETEDDLNTEDKNETVTTDDQKISESTGEQQVANNTEGQPVVKEAPAFGVYSNFTFEPGNRIVFYDDFEKDRLGDFPLKWETNGSGEVVTNSLHPGKWLSIAGRSGYFPSLEELPENYTLEFDLLTNGFTDNRNASSMSLAFINKKAYNTGAAGGNAHLRIILSNSAGMSIQNSGAEKTPRIASNLSRKFKLDELVHFSVAVNKKRLRIWMEEEKIVDIPSLLVGNMGRYLLFEIYGIYPDKGHSILISNLKIAESKEDIRSQLLDKGRFSTTGIYFNTDKAEIKPESYAVIKSVADYLKENPEVNIQIIGHTDAQGDEEYNLSLSQKRAQSVIVSLVQQFGIDASRLSALGKGETEPVDDNETITGRANNRRVEFVKI